MKTTHGVFLEYDSSSRSAAPNFIISKEVSLGSSTTYNSRNYSEPLILVKKISLQHVHDTEGQWLYVYRTRRPILEGLQSTLVQLNYVCLIELMTRLRSVRYSNYKTLT